MTATINTGKRGKAAAIVRLRVGVFDRLCDEHDAVTEIAKAELVGSDRGTVYRLRKGQINPSGELMMRWANRLGVTVEDLWEVTDA